MWGHHHVQLWATPLICETSFRGHHLWEGKLGFIHSSHPTWPRVYLRGLDSQLGPSKSNGARQPRGHRSLRMQVGHCPGAGSCLLKLRDAGCVGGGGYQGGHQRHLPQLTVISSQRPLVPTLTQNSHINHIKGQRGKVFGCIRKVELSKLRKKKKTRLFAFAPSF